MKALLMVLGVAAIAVAPLAARAADKDFVTVANAYVEDMLKANPEAATTLGDHRYDAQLTDRSASAIAAQTQMNKDYLQKLAAIDPKSLSQTNQIDYTILKSNLERGVFENEELKEQEWNPIYYNMGSAIFALVARDFAPLDQRLASLKGRLQQIPNVIAAAKANLKNPPEMHTKTAIQQNQGNIGLIRDDLTQFVSQSPAMEKELAPVRAAAVAALEEYGQWLEKDLLPRSTGDFRLGDALWRKKLRFSLDSDLSKEEIYTRAQADLKATQQAMYATALPLFKAYFPEEKDEAKLKDMKYVNKAVLDHIAQSHPSNADIVDKAKAALAEATQFVRDKKLVTVPKEPVKVIVMPEFQRGVAVAYCEAPGPLEPHADTFFSIAPTPKDWTPERTESFFKEYNDKRNFLERSVCRGMGCVHREDDGGRRLRRPRGAHAAAQDETARDHQLNHRPEDPHRKHERSGRDGAHDERRLPGRRRSGGQVAPRLPHLDAAFDVLRRQRRSGRHQGRLGGEEQTQSPQDERSHHVVRNSVAQVHQALNGLVVSS
jgi:hypothetical protein